MNGLKQKISRKQSTVPNSLATCADCSDWHRNIMLHKIIIYYITTPLIVLLLAGAAISGNFNIETLRPEGTKRVYQLTLGDQKLGELESVAKGKSSLEGIKGYRFDEKLTLDFTPFGNEYKLKIENRHYIDSLGQYIGDEMEFEVNDQPQELSLTNKSGRISGYWEKEKQKESINLSIGDIKFAADNYMLDQIELFLAGHDISVGETIMDSIFVPQSMIKTPVRIVIEAFVRTPYGDMNDSAFVCHFEEPSDQIIYFTKTNKIIKMIQPSQKIQAVLSESPFDRARSQKKPMTFSQFINRTPFYFLYIFIGTILAIPFLKKNYKKADIYLASLLGILIYFLIEFTQQPLQQWYISSVFIPGLKQGGSIYFYSMISSLITGVSQEILKLIPILFLFIGWKRRSLEMTTLGLFVGLGFGLGESWTSVGNLLQTGALRVMGWGVFEKIFAIIFHMASGAIIGYAINQSYRITTFFLLAIILIHSFSVYLAVFVQKRIIDTAILEISMALISLILVLLAYLIIRKQRGKIPAKSQPLS
jgi:hypothetical protein